MARPDTLLIPVDLDEPSRAAVERGLGLARWRGGRLRIVHVSARGGGEVDPELPELSPAERRAYDRARFERFLEPWSDSDVPLESQFALGDPAAEILSRARASDVHSIVMGAHGRHGFDRLILGSVAERVAQQAPRPTWVVRSGVEAATRPVRSILFATDFSPDAERVEAAVAEWATALHAEVEVLHAICDTAVLFAPYAVVGSEDFDGELLEAARRRTSKVLERLADRGVTAKARIEHGPAAATIVERAESAGVGLIVLGARGYSGWQACWQHFVLGSTTLRVLRHAPCDVLVGSTRRPGPPRFRPAA